MKVKDLYDINPKLSIYTISYWKILW